MNMPDHRSITVLAENDIPEVGVTAQVASLIQVVKELSHQNCTLKEEMQKQVQSMEQTDVYWEQTMQSQRRLGLQSMNELQQHIFDGLQHREALEEQVHQLRTSHPLICQICTENTKSMFTICGHGYCDSCLRQWFVRHGTCPHCNVPISMTDVRRSYLDPPNPNIVASGIIEGYFSDEVDDDL